MKTVKFAIALGMFATAILFGGASATAAEAILINFSSDHCSHCRAMEPVLAQLEQSGVPIRHVNVAVEAATQITVGYDPFQSIL